jgi:hypothetical protein
MAEILLHELLAAVNHSFLQLILNLHNLSTKFLLLKLTNSETVYFQDNKEVPLWNGLRTRGGGGGSLLTLLDFGKSNLLSLGF